MATAAEHLAQSERNAAVAQQLAESADYDWAVTALFYASLHLVQAYLLRRGIRVQTHGQRIRQMMSLAELEPIVDSYRVLQTHSENARYECRNFSSSEFAAIRNGRYSQVLSHLRSLLEAQ